jgi:hypothetical protein
MTVKKSTTKMQRFTPTKSRTPVIAGRVPESLHQQIKQAAKRSGRTMSDELAFCVVMRFEWEKAFGDIKKMLAEHERVLERDLLAYLRAKGWRSVAGPNGNFWVPPEVPIPQLSVQMPDRLIEEINEVIRQAIAEAKRGQS